MPSSNSFYVVIPSNTNVLGNRTNSFRVRLPRKLQFGSDWDVGLAVIVYPHSWPSLGTAEEQFVQIQWKTGESVQIAVPATKITSPGELKKTLHKLLGEGSEQLAQKVRTAQNSFWHAAKKARQAGRDQYIGLRKKEKRSVEEEDKLLVALMSDIGTMVDIQGVAEGLVERERRAETSKVPLREPEDNDESYQKKLDEYFARLRGQDLELLEDLIRKSLNEEIKQMHEDDRSILDSTKDLGMEAWVHAYRKVRSTCKFAFDTASNRFSIKLDPRYVKRLKISEQLAYILGFAQTEFTEAENVAKFMPDMAGGVSTFHVYAPDIVEPMMIGDVTAPVLRIVTIRGKPDEIIEEQFLSIQYHRVLVKEIQEIFIEIRTSSGVLMPFQYGTCTLTLHFRKCSYF